MDTDTTTRTEIDAAHDLVRQYSDHAFIDILHNGIDAPAIVMPEGRTIQSLKKLIDEFREHPERRKGDSAMLDLDSFIDITNRFKSPFSAVFAVNEASTAGDLKVTSVFDYHDPQTGDDSHARFMGHKAHYRFPLSDEWKAWHGKNDALLDQSDFAEFLEDHITEVAAPPEIGQKPELTDFEKHLANLIASLQSRICGPSSLMELSRGLEIRTEEKLESTQRLATGEMSLTFSTEHKDSTGGQLKVPDLFVINIPVFKNGPSYLIPVRLRFKKSGGKVEWKFMLHRSEIVLDHAFREAAEKVREKTELPVFYGRHE
jgi:uncharacterized protein YfdQ (DUF2303 family)